MLSFLNSAKPLIISDSVKEANSFVVPWLSQNQISLTLLLGTLSLGLLIFVLFLLRKVLNQSQQFKQAIHQLDQASIVKKEKLASIQTSLDSHFMQLNQQVISRLGDEKSKQIEAFNALKIGIEKRFSDFSTALNSQQSNFNQEINSKIFSLPSESRQSILKLSHELTSTLLQFGEKQSAEAKQNQSQTREIIDQNIRQGLIDIRQDIDRSIQSQNDNLSKSLKQLTESTSVKLNEISGQVEQRLSQGFEKTTQTFTDILKRLALIDDAQKRITELSGNVVSLQEVLNDKRSRGAFGEVQLQSLISNTIPDKHYTMQKKLSNGRIADCFLQLPKPTGNIAIDAKFPLESYRKMTDISLSGSDRNAASRQFAKDIKKHINDIAQKYIIPSETADGAVMFIPAESVFAEIHGHFPELVEYSYRQKVWLVSPTTLMAILTTAAAVIKDELTRQQVHIIQEHLGLLGKDFGRFQERMDSLSRHMGQVSKDVEQVHVSARKITRRFDKIESVELVAELAEPPSTEQHTPLLHEKSV